MSKQNNPAKGKPGKAVVLDGSQAQDHTGARMRLALRSELHARGWEVQEYLLREKKIGNCAGDFFCWVRSPGVCNTNDDNREIARSIANSALLVYLTPITFGGYSATLKKAVDHQIQNISPFFSMVNGETHHQKRYREYPDFLAIGWMDGEDKREEATFHHLVWRNALNFYAESAVAGVARSCQADEEFQHAVKRWLDDLRRGARPRRVPLPVYRPLAAGDGRVRSALLLVGSPRTRASTSNALGEYLFEQLRARGVRTETRYLHTIVRSPEKMRGLLQAVDGADLVVLAYPLYVDTLPAPVIEALESIAAQPASRAPGRLFAAVANCGFPEAAHNATALANCAGFAEQAGFVWAGSLSLGAGQGMVHGRSLNELDGRVIPLKAALDLAAEALAHAGAIPAAAQDLLAKPFIPAWLYRQLGWMGWKQQARQYGAGHALRRKPYTESR